MRVSYLLGGMGAAALAWVVPVEAGGFIDCGPAGIQWARFLDDDSDELPLVTDFEGAVDRSCFRASVPYLLTGAVLLAGGLAAGLALDDRQQQPTAWWDGTAWRPVPAGWRWDGRQWIPGPGWWWDGERWRDPNAPPPPGPRTF